jgi:hypothetical protein
MLDILDVLAQGAHLLKNPVSVGVEEGVYQGQLRPTVHQEGVNVAPLPLPHAEDSRRRFHNYLLVSWILQVADTGATDL